MNKKLLLFSFGLFILHLNLKCQNLPYYTGFDNATEQSGWQLFQTGDIGSGAWGIGGGGSSLPTCVSHDYNVGGAATDTVIDWYVSPMLNFTGPSTISLLVRRTGFSVPFEDNCEVWFGSGSADPEIGSFQLIGNISFVSPQFEWIDTTFEINEVSSEGYIAFRYKTIGAAWSTYSIDNVNIELQTSNTVAEPFSGIRRMNVSPNPASGELTVKLDADLSNVEVNIYNLCGQKILSPGRMYNGQKKVNLESLDIGLYFIRAEYNGRVLCCERVVVR